MGREAVHEDSEDRAGWRTARRAGGRTEPLAAGLGGRLCIHERHAVVDGWRRRRDVGIAEHVAATRLERRRSRVGPRSRGGRQRRTGRSQAGVVVDQSMMPAGRLLLTRAPQRRTRRWCRPVVSARAREPRHRVVVGHRLLWRVPFSVDHEGLSLRSGRGAKRTERLRASAAPAVRRCARSRPCAL